MVALNIDGWKQNGWFEKMMDENMCLFCVSKLSRFFFWKYAPLYFKLLRRLGLIYGVINSYVLGCWPLNRQYNSIKLILLCSKHSIHNQLADLHLFFFWCFTVNHFTAFALLKQIKTWQFHKIIWNKRKDLHQKVTTDNGLPD